MYSKPEPPEVPDHYAALGVGKDDAVTVLKREFRKRALKYHPDKQAPGATVDAVEFRKVREAYEILIDPGQREEYELEYPDIQDQWAHYRRDLDVWQQRTAAEAQAEAQRAKNRTTAEARERLRKIWRMGENEKVRRAARQYEDDQHAIGSGAWYMFGGCYCAGCLARRERLHNERRNNIEFPSQLEYAEYLHIKAEQAERRTREAAHKRQEEQAREAMERMQKEQEKAERVRATAERKRAAKLKVKDERSKETARRAREHQEKDAQLRMFNTHIKEQQEKFLRAMEDRGEAIEHKEYVMEIGWAKKKGVAKCLFCDEQIKYYSFVCPEGGAVACNPCKNGMCRFTPPETCCEEVEEGVEDGSTTPINEDKDEDPTTNANEPQDPDKDPVVNANESQDQADTSDPEK